MTTFKTSLAAAITTLAVCLPAIAAIYRVGPREEHATVSEVADRLAPGDVVEVVADVVDRIVLTRHGTSAEPITIRGVVRTGDGRTTRPRILPPSPDGTIVTCVGDWIRLEGLDFTVPAQQSDRKCIGVIQRGDSLTIRNCRFSHFNFKAILTAAEAGSITIEFCEFESCGSVPLDGKTVDIWSWTPGAVARIEHCYFHDSLRECHLKTHCTRNVVRYNWFENSYQQALKVSDRIRGYSPERPEDVYPMHTDIVGNVFIQGHSPGGRFSVLSIGGQAQDELGTEGDFTIAHNLFVQNANRSPRDPSPFILTHGNVDRIRLFNNVFLQMEGQDQLLYLRDLEWDAPETQAFVARRGSPLPVVDGAGNWVSEGVKGIPEGLVGTLRGLDPKFVDMLNLGFRPRKDSPLAGAGMMPLPRGQVVELVPEYEPQRGIPADLKPWPRRKVDKPAIGPFEVAEGPALAISDDAVEMVLAVKDNGTRFSWPLKYGLARQEALTALKAGEKEEALSYAKMQFLLCPLESTSVDLSIGSVRQMLVALDGNEDRMQAFEEYARKGPAGPDGKAGTADDLKDPISDVRPVLYSHDKAYYAEFDKTIDARAAVSATWEKHWYETQKAFERLDGGEFGDAAAILVTTLAETIKVPHAVDDENWELQRIQDIVDRIHAGLGVVYRARTGTVAGVEAFVKQCDDFSLYGPVGKDGQFGTDDDLAAPI